MSKFKVEISGETIGEIVEKMKSFLSQMTPTESVESDAKTATDATEKKPKKQNVKAASKPEAAPEKAPASESSVSKDEVMKKIQAVSGKLGMAKAKEIVATHANGVGKIVDIKSEYFDAVASACDEALAG